MSNKKIFVVYITKYSGTKLPSWYIGSSNKEKVIKGYNGSVGSKKWKEIYEKEQKENKHLFKTKVLSYHETRKEAFEEEYRLQMLHRVKTNNKYFNEAVAAKNGFFGRDVSGELNPNYGKKWTDKQKENLSKQNKGMVNVRNKTTKECFQVTREEWKNNPNLEAESKGRKIKDTSKYNNKGINNPRAQIIEIYNNKELMFLCEGNFFKICKENKLPYGALGNSHRNNGKPIYSNVKNQKSTLEKAGKLKYQGWYAIKKENK